MTILKSAALITALGILVTGCLLSPAIRAADRPVVDSEDINKLLADAKAEALVIKKDAGEMQSFTRSNLGWETYSLKIEAIKAHINTLGRLTTKLADLRENASPWQETAIDRITPVLRELADNTSATIDHLNNNLTRIHTPAFRDLVDANYDLSTQMAALVVDFVDYGRTKAKFERLRNKLEIDLDEDR